MTFSNFSGAIIDMSFKMPSENNNLLWMDLSMLFEPASIDEIELQREVQKHKSRLKKYNRNKDKFSARKKRLGVNDQVSITNYSDQLFYGSLYLGTQNFEVNVIFDTSYDWLLIEGENCQTCTGKKYKYRESGSFETVKSI